MQDKPLIFFDPYPRNEEMVLTNDVKTELEKISNLIYHFGSCLLYTSPSPRDVP